MDEDAGRKVLQKITQKDETAFEGFLNVPKMGSTPDWGTEWGLGKAKDGSDECFITQGDQTEVFWTEYLPYLEPLAHSHPYFEGKIPRAKTKSLGKGNQMDFDNWKSVVKWDEILAPKTVPNSQSFPSAADVAFMIDNKLLRHNVYTPYVCLDGYKGETSKFLANPNDEKVELDLKGKPRLNYEISDAVEIKPEPTKEESKSEDVEPDTRSFKSKMVARADGAVWGTYLVSSEIVKSKSQDQHTKVEPAS